MSAKRSTRRQHFIPRLMLKGFAERASQEYYAYEFRRETKPQKKNIRKIGFANKFYGDSGLEDQLADRESNYAVLLDNLRKNRIDESNNQLINELISHLFSRTHNLRQGLKEFATRAWARMLKALEETEIGGAFHKGMIEKIKADPRLQQFIKVIPTANRHVFLRLFDQKVAGPELWLDTIKEMRRNMETIDLGKAVGDAQIQALSSENPYKSRMDLLQSFRWTILGSAPNTFLLGDVGPIGRNNAVSEWRNLITFDGITEIVLPISHDRLLLGNATADPTQIDLASVNLASVELSRDFFVAHTNNSSERDYVSKLGDRSELVTSEEIESLANITLT